MNVKKSVILAFLVAVGILLQLLESFVGIFMIVSLAAAIPSWANASCNSLRNE